MKKLLFMLVVGVLTATVNSWAGDDMEGVAIAFNALPSSVQQMALKSFDVRNISEIEKRAEAETVQYDVEGISNGEKIELTFAEDGTLIQQSVQTDFAALPALAKQALMKDYPDGEVREIEKVVETFYQVEITADGKTRNIEVKASGDIEDEFDNDGIYDDAD